MFSPPFCPHRSCSQHAAPRPGFCVRYGRYRPACRARPVQRYRCRACRRSFSRQTFRADYRDHRPDLNPKLFLLLASGLGLRQSARILGLSWRCTELKFRKIARHLRRLNLSLRAPLDGERSFHLDEFESYEGERNTRPLSIPMLIDTDTRYIVWAESAPIRPRGKMTPRRRKALKRSQKRHGVRRDLSREALARTLARGADLVRSARKSGSIATRSRVTPGSRARPSVDRASCTCKRTASSCGTPPTRCSRSTTRRRSRGT